VAELTPELQDALHDLNQYLSDNVAPLIVTDAVTLLMTQPPELMAAEIQNWTLLQYQGAREQMPVSDYLFHAVKKLALLGDFGLIAKDQILPYIERLAPVLATLCPEGDRQFFFDNLQKLARPQPLLATPVTVIHRQMGTQSRLATDSQAPQQAAAQAPPPLRSAGLVPTAVHSAVPVVVPEDNVRLSRLVTLLLDRYERDLGVAAAPGSLAPAVGPRPDPGQLIAAVANKSATGRELDQDLARLKTLGIDAGMDQVFSFLGNSIPGWSLPVNESPAADEPQLPTSAPVEAMHRIINMAEDPAEATHRLHELVKAAVAQFNEGLLSRAVTMFELAEKVIGENKVKPSVVEALRRTGHEFLHLEQLKQYGDAPERHAQLRKVMAFYLPLRPSGLLEELAIAPKRDRRRQLLTFMEVHGPGGRAEALDWLQRSFTGNIARDDWHIQRNLVHVVRRIPRPADVSSEAELEMLATLADPSRPAPLVKEVIASLGQMRQDKAEQLLARLVTRFEERLVQGQPPAAEAGELRALIDRAIAALARAGTPNARRVVVGHGLKNDTRLGDTVGRLAELATSDLSADKTIFERLTKALQEELPKKVLGVVVKPQGNRAVALIRALAGTASARELLTQIVREHPAEEIGREAHKAVSAPVGVPGPTGSGTAPSAPAGSTPAPAGSSPGFSGDLELFGLPNLLQSLAQSSVTGVLRLHGSEAQVLGTLSIRKGQMMEAQVGHLQGADAVYQLLERPVAATFQFASRPDAELPPGSGTEILSLLFEGMRRYDEFQRAAALVPDEAPLASTGMAPTAHPEETDQAVVTAVWTRARGGAPALLCESQVPTDAYRIRRLLAHWVEQGSLKLR
jgi:hypothetical protein